MKLAPLLAMPAVPEYVQADCWAHLVRPAAKLGVSKLASLMPFEATETWSMKAVSPPPLLPSKPWKVMVYTPAATVNAADSYSPNNVLTGSIVP